MVDQTPSTGRWNSLGTYTFQAGSTGSVVISGSGSNGTVMADAILFHYLGP